MPNQEQQREEDNQLIKRFLHHENGDGLRASVEHYYKTGKPSGGLYIALRELIKAAKEYHKGEVDVESIKPGLILFLGNKINRVDLPTMTETINYLLPHLQPRAESEAWMSVNDNLPEVGRAVLVYLKSEIITVAYLKKETPTKTVWQLYGPIQDISELQYDKALFWQPLPAVPKTQTSK